MLVVIRGPQRRGRAGAGVFNGMGSSRDLASTASSTKKADKEKKIVLQATQQKKSRLEGSHRRKDLGRVHHYVGHSLSTSAHLPGSVTDSLRRWVRGTDIPSGTIQHWVASPQVLER